MSSGAFCGAFRHIEDLLGTIDSPFGNWCLGDKLWLAIGDLGVQMGMHSGAFEMSFGDLR